MAELEQTGEYDTNSKTWCKLENREQMKNSV
jgi:hypothetical protein